MDSAVIKGQFPLLCLHFHLIVILKRHVNSCTSAGCVSEGASMMLVVRSAWLSIRGQRWLTPHTLTLSVCYVTVWICWPYTCWTGLTTDAPLAVLTVRNEEGSLLQKCYRLAFVCSSSPTLFNRKEVKQRLFVKVFRVSHCLQARFWVTLYLSKQRSSWCAENVTFHAECPICFLIDTWSI